MGIPNKLDISVIPAGSKDRVKAVFLGFFKDGDPKQKHYSVIDKHGVRKMADMVAEGEITGEYKEFTTIQLKDGPFDTAIVLGLGKKEDYCLDKLRSCAAKAARTLRKISTREMAMYTDSFGDYPEARVAQVASEGVVMGLYKFLKLAKEDKNRTKPQVEKLVFICSDKSKVKEITSGAERGRCVGFATNEARDLANTPANFVTPLNLTEVAREIAKGNKSITLKIHDRKSLDKMGAGGILSVARGSVKEPFLIEMNYSCGKKDAPTVALIGKGITFDSGGISIKPSDGMHLMKYDMHGAATVLSTMRIVAETKPGVNVLCLVPTCENMPDADAYRPGDVITMFDGQTVEIITTDAEGRLLLGDAIAYAANQKVDAIIDVATLTGAIVVALGHIATGIFSNNPWLAKKVVEAGEICSELAWELPMFKEYEIQIGSSVADMKNSGGRAAGSVTAGLFLKKFVKDVPWVHLDIAGVAWMEEDSSLYNHKPYLPKKGATGVAVRTLAALLEHMADLSGGKKAKLQDLLKA